MKITFSEIGTIVKVFEVYAPAYYISTALCNELSRREMLTHELARDRAPLPPYLSRWGAAEALLIDLKKVDRYSHEYMDSKAHRKICATRYGERSDYRDFFLSMSLEKQLEMIGNALIVASNFPTSTAVDIVRAVFASREEIGG